MRKVRVLSGVSGEAFCAWPTVPESCPQRVPDAVKAEELGVAREECGCELVPCEPVPRAVEEYGPTVKAYRCRHGHRLHVKPPKE
jgi:hypothetical protein